MIGGGLQRRGHDLLLARSCQWCWQQLTAASAVTAAAEVTVVVVATAVAAAEVTTAQLGSGAVRASQYCRLDTGAYRAHVSQLHVANRTWDC